MTRSLVLFALLALSCADCGGVQPAPSNTASPTAPALRKPSLSSSSLSPEVINERIRAEWKKEGVEPSPDAGDARFLRRAYIDIAGVIPPLEKVTTFLADTAPGKRAREVEALLADPRYADHFTDVWDRVLMGRAARTKTVDRAAFRAWLHEKFEKNIPYDKLVREIITATGRNSEGGASYAGAMAPDTKMGAEDGAEEAGGASETAPVNGAVNWLLRYGKAPADLSGVASRVFLGVQIQCAQCHDHKTEKWTVDDFRGFTACFARARIEPIDPPNVKGIRRVEVRDVERPTAAGPKKRAGAMREYASATPKAIDGTDLSESPGRRQALAAWMSAPENPWFSKAIVNRMWAHFLGRGFVDPVDDLRPGNPGVMPDLLDRIAEDFEASGYDLKRLMRLITATEAYGRAAAPAKGGDAAARLWARFRVEPMTTGELLDSIFAAASLDPVLERVAGASRDELKLKIEQQVTFLFDVDEEPAGDDEISGTIPQALFLLNGLLVGVGTSAIPGGALRDVLAMQGGDEAKVRSLYLRTLSREPLAEELARWIALMSAPHERASDAKGSDPQSRASGKKKGRPGKKGRDPLRRLANNMKPAEDAHGQAYEDLFWALLNSSEFVLNH